MRGFDDWLTTEPEPLCWQCGERASGEIPTGPPEHEWHWWCPACLRAENVRRRAQLQRPEATR